MIIPEEEIVYVMELFKVRGPLFPYPGKVKTKTAA